MPGVVDLVKARPVSAVGLLAGFVAIPIVVPSARPQWAAAVKAGVKLLLEAQDDSEAGIIEDLVDDAVDDLAKARVHPEPQARADAAEAAVRRFQQRAKRRSQRGRDEDDRRRRYARHMDALKRRLSSRSAAAPERRRDVWDHALSVLGAPTEPPSPATKPPARRPTTAGTRSGGAQLGGTA